MSVEGICSIVGKVPKYVAVTPNGKYVLATNWCSYDLSVIDAATGQEVKRLPMGPYPRGIVVSPDSTTAYIAVMGTHDIARVDLTNFNVTWFRGVGGGHDDGEVGKRTGQKTSSMPICDGPSSPILIPAWVPTTFTSRQGKATDIRN